jgi:oxygen-independent coproporphyrinogen-3 oxidase
MSARTVTTVHLGGGTPGTLPFQWLLEICSRLRAKLSISEDTEWAIESPTRLLTPDHVEALRRAGFTRLHVGVQSLDDDVRTIIGRAEDARTVRERLVSLNASTFVTTVDVVYGLPRQSTQSLLETLAALVDVGISGVSLYQFQVSSRNRKFSKRYAQEACDPMRAFELLEAADDYLSAGGYRKNHFTHYALPRDRNLYYTHPIRGEDLLGLGPSGDGVFGSYRYRNGLLPAYLRAESAASALQGGIDDVTMNDGASRRFRAHLASGCFDRREFPRWASLINEWTSQGYLRAHSGDNRELTARGVWRIAEMMSSVEQRPLD